jgi:hypothetical protein
MRVIWSLLALFHFSAVHAQNLQAPPEASIDSKVVVQIIGTVDPKAFVSIVEPTAEEGTYGDYSYARSPQVTVPAPGQAGRYEVRLLDAERPYRTLAKQPIEIVMPQTAMEAPDSVPISNKFEVHWSGPSGSGEYITLVPKETPDGDYGDYVYTRGEGSGTLKLSTPSTAGEFELRYMTSPGNVVIGRRALRVGEVALSLQFTPTAGMGERLSVRWEGPGNPRDYITIVPPAAPTSEPGDYQYTRVNPVELVVPEVPGRYEVRYLSADGERILARGSLEVGAASASLKGPPQAVAGEAFMVEWSGPDNELDYIAITQPGKPDEYLHYTYTRRGSPLALAAPKQPGRFELHYLTGRSNQSLASQSIEVTPAASSGSLRVVPTTANAGAAGGGAADAIELILDASGSMLQKLDGQRRIDIAREALTGLIERDIAPATPVALRVFGHRQPDACDTALLEPLAPLDRAILAGKVRAIEAKNLAKTPIAASLAAVAEDLAGVEGRATVILVTDGEETCDGDPAAEIEKLQKLGFEVSLNIVGFAVDEYALEQDFRRWAALGGGTYFSAGDADSLRRSVSQATRRPFAVFRDGDQVAAGVVGGEALELKPGAYEVRIGDKRLPVEVRADAETLLQY